jgi:hypothetical protein
MTDKEVLTLMSEIDNKTVISILMRFVEKLIAQHIKSSNAVYYRKDRCLNDRPITDVNIILSEIFPYVLWLSNQYFERYYGCQLVVANFTIESDPNGLNRKPKPNFYTNITNSELMFLYCLFVRVIFVDYFSSTSEKPVNISEISAILNH